MILCVEHDSKVALYFFSILDALVALWFFLFAGIANLYERICNSYLRSWAASECLEQIKADDQFTHCISIGPVRTTKQNTIIIIVL